MMSASENQACRKAEFNQVVEEQLEGPVRDAADRSRVERRRPIGGHGRRRGRQAVMRERKAKVLATEIVRDAKGQPVIVQESPLNRYGIKITQFSVTETEYDPADLGAIRRQEAVLPGCRASEGPATRGATTASDDYRAWSRQVAETEAAANLEKKKATVAAQQEQEVAVIRKAEAVTQGPAERRSRPARQAGSRDPEGDRPDQG